MFRLTVCSIALLFSSLLYAGFDYPMRAEAVAENTYAIVTPTRALPNPQNGGWNSNSAFVVTDNGVLLFDTGSSTAIGEVIRETIAGITDLPVRWIINSHAHGDHWLGNAAFEDTVDQVIASETVANEIVTDGERWIGTFNDMTGGITGDSKIVAPNIRIEQDQELTLGGLKLELKLSGGSHSPGDLMVWLPNRKVLFAGDVVYSDRMPSTNAGDLRQWIGQLDQLMALKPDTVIAGHGVVTDLQGLERLRSLLSTLWQAVEAGVDEGLSDYEMLPDVAEQLAQFEPHFPGLKEKLKRDLSHVFLQVEAAAFE